ncbi:DUF4129 domain-containing protein [Atopomonas sediminilitoris]|uniref:DUF4129 domain-containing protein n=1 Tax=Atopomonas sediminilitoris TaxID=2919919 RepID=UPI001F4DD2BC|nr:DUF4129 domain-containing protein [Atopomonas sediminilitoris]MCJ8168679.1 DUF4129 domain-containing protein [Atopomonas sediminilitoris]
MQLNNAQVVIRPRNPWEAADLGIHFARQHAGLLLGSMAILLSAWLGLLSIVLYDYPGIAGLIFWWCKPLYDRLPLLIVSRALFNAKPTLKQSLRELPQQLKAQWFASLTWRRFSPSRSFDLPVTQLEGLNGLPRKQRLQVLSLRNSQPASALTLVGFHLEAVLLIGLFGLLFMLLPPEVYANWDWRFGDWLDDESEAHWLDHLSNWVYALVLVVWEPIYVACGFTLYLNRRTELEAWDTELSFRRLTERLQRAAPLALMVFALLLPLSYSPSSQAAALCLPPSLNSTPKAERLLSQTLTSPAAQTSIQSILADKPFSNKRIEHELKWGEDQPKPKSKEERGTPWWLKYLIESWKHTSGIAYVAEVVLWLLVLTLLGWLLWHYRRWLGEFVGRLQNIQRPQRQRPSTLFGLELDSQSLPADIAGSALALWNSDPRQALSLLYRGLLVHLLDQHQVPIKSSHTENEVLGLLDQQQLPALYRYSQHVTQHWINLAYGHRLPADRVIQQLCQAWRTLEARQAGASSATPREAHA